MIKSKTFNIVIVGNPNVGKTTIFNALVGRNQKCTNYPATTVEQRTGILKLSSSKKKVMVCDLPGAFSLTPHSMDEVIVHNTLFGKQTGCPQPDLVIIVVDASNLERNLFFASQVLETGRRALLVLNMWDLVEQLGLSIDVKGLDHRYSVRAVKTCAVENDGIRQLKNLIETELLSGKEDAENIHFHLPCPEQFEEERKIIENFIKSFLPAAPFAARGESMRILSDSRFYSPLFYEIGEPLKELVLKARKRLEEKDIDWTSIESITRYWFIHASYDAVVKRIPSQKPKWKFLDSVYVHPIWGLIIFCAVMVLIFPALFYCATPLVEVFSKGLDWISDVIFMRVPDGILKDYAENLWFGFTSVLRFLPYVLVYFFFVAILENSGYLSRALLVLSRLFRKTALNAKAFIPFVNSYQSSTIGIVSARNMNKMNNRMLVFLLSPFVNYGLRLPALIIVAAAIIPPIPIYSFFDLRSVVIITIYFLSLIKGYFYAASFQQALDQKVAKPYILALSQLHVPSVRAVVQMAIQPVVFFVLEISKMIILISVMVTALQVYFEQSGMLNHKLMALLSALIQPESFISTLAIMNEKASFHFSPLVAVTLFVLVYLFCQWLLLIKMFFRSTKSLVWTISVACYLIIVGAISAMIVYQVGHFLGFV